MTHKLCSACGESKPTADFGCNAARPDGLQSECKTCRKDKAATKRARTVEAEEAKAAQLQQSAEIEYEIAHIAKRQARAHDKHYKIPHPDGFRYALDLIPLEPPTNTDVETLIAALEMPQWHKEQQAAIQAIKDCEAVGDTHGAMVAYRSFKKPEADQLIEHMKNEPDAAKAWAYYSKFNKLMQELCCCASVRAKYG